MKPRKCTPAERVRACVGALTWCGWRMSLLYGVLVHGNCPRVASDLTSATGPEVQHVYTAGDDALLRQKQASRKRQIAAQQKQIAAQKHHIAVQKRQISDLGGTPAGSVSAGGRAHVRRPREVGVLDPQ